MKPPFRSVMLGLLILSTDLNTPVLADEFSSRFSGLWVGTGLIRPRLFDAPQTTKCRVASEQRENGILVLSGRCATPSRSGRFSVTISRTENNTYTARFQTFGSPDIELFGRRDGAIMEFSSKDPVEQIGFTYTSKFRISFPDDQTMTISDFVTNTVNGEESQSISMTFQRQP